MDKYTLSMDKYTLSKGFITQKIGGKTTIFSGEDSVLYTLNESAAYIFQGLKLGWKNKKIIEGLVKRYEITKKRARKDIEDLIRDLLRRKIFQLT